MANSEYASGVWTDLGPLQFSSQHKHTMSSWIIEVVWGEIKGLKHKAPKLCEVENVTLYRGLMSYAESIPEQKLWSHLFWFGFLVGKWVGWSCRTFAQNWAFWHVIQYRQQRMRKITSEMTLLIGVTWALSAWLIRERALVCRKHRRLWELPLLFLFTQKAEGSQHLSPMPSMQNQACTIAITSECSTRLLLSQFCFWQWCSCQVSI